MASPSVDVRWGMRGGKTAQHQLHHFMKNII